MINQSHLISCYFNFGYFELNPFIKYSFLMVMMELSQNLINLSPQF